MAGGSEFIQIIIEVGILLFAAKLMAELFLRLKLPIVLGELLAGMIVGPFALGSLFVVDGQALLQIDKEIKLLGEIGAIVILFMAGLEMTPKEFLRGGKASFTVGTLGVVVPFFAGLIIFQMFGFNALQSMLIATALTATSIAISVQVLNELGKLKTPEARLIIGAAIVDDILAIAVLSVVTSIAGSPDGLDNIDIGEVTMTILQILGFFAAMLIAAVIIMPRLMTQRFWKAQGSVEGIATASFFGAAAFAGSIGLSPIVGAFAVGMALSTTKIFKKVGIYAEKIALIFAPLFFAIIGAQVDLRAVDLHILMVSAAVIAVAIATKLFGCGLPAIYFLKSRTRGMRVGVGMISRGEVGLIVAGVGVGAGILASDVYSTIVIMVAVTTLITPIWLKMQYRGEISSASGNDTDINDKGDNGDNDYHRAAEDNNKNANIIRH